MTMVAVGASKDGATAEYLWVEEVAPGRGIVQGIVLSMPIGLQDEVRYEAQDGRLVLTGILRRGPMTSIGVVLKGDATKVSALIGALVEEAGESYWVRGIASRGVFAVAGEGLTKATVYDWIHERIEGLSVSITEISGPTSSLDIDAHPLPELHRDPLALDMVGAYLARHEVLERIDVLRMAGDLPDIEPVRIVHASLNAAAIDPRIRRAWRDGQLDAALISGARLIVDDLPSYADDIFTIFTYRADGWPKES